jgi:hypothetical protein
MPKTRKYRKRSGGGFFDFLGNSNPEYKQCVQTCKEQYPNNSNTQGWGSSMYNHMQRYGESINPALQNFGSRFNQRFGLGSNSGMGMGTNYNSGMDMDTNYNSGMGPGMSGMNNNMPNNLNYQNGGYRSSTPLNNLASSAAHFNGKTAQPQVWVGGKRRTRKSRRRTRRTRRH